MHYELILAAYLEALIGLSVFIFRRSLRDPRDVISTARVAGLMVIPIVGLFGHTLLVFDLLVAAIPLCAGRSAKKLAGINLLFICQFPAMATPLSAGSHYLFSFSAIYAFNAGSLIALLVVRQPAGRSHGAIDACVALMFLVYCVATARNLPFDDILRALVQNFLNIVPPYLVLSRTLGSAEDAAEAAMCFVLGALCNAVVGIFEAIRHLAMYEQFYDGLGMQLPNLSSYTYIRGGLLQARGAVENSAVLSLLTGMAVLPCLAFRKQFRQSWWTLVIALLILGMLASASRGGWIATGVGVAAYLIYTARHMAATALAAVVALGYAFIDILPRGGRIGEIVGRSGHAQETADYRVNLLHRGVEEVRAHPFGGQSAAQLQITMNDLRQGLHIIDFVNTHLFIALTVGLGGLAAWLLAWGIPLILAWPARESAHGGAQRATGRLSAVSPLAMVVACFTALTFTSTVDHMLPLTMLSFGSLASFLSIRRSQARSNSRGGATSHQRVLGLAGTSVEAGY